VAARAKVGYDLFKLRKLATARNHETGDLERKIDSLTELSENISTMTDRQYDEYRMSCLKNPLPKMLLSCVLLILVNLNVHESIYYFLEGRSDLLSTTTTPFLQGHGGFIRVVLSFVSMIPFWFGVVELDEYRSYRKDPEAFRNRERRDLEGDVQELKKEFVLESRRARGGGNAGSGHRGQKNGTPPPELPAGGIGIITGDMPADGVRPGKDA